MDGLANRCEGTRRVRSYNVNRLASSPVAMRYYSNILERIGNTPVVQLPKIMDGMKGLVLAKLEMMDPGGSAKDRIGEMVIEDAEAKGTLKPGGTIIEPTCRHTGRAFARHRRAGQPLRPTDADRRTNQLGQQLPDGAETEGSSHRPAPGRVDPEGLFL